jgi:hypothetical protein
MFTIPSSYAAADTKGIGPAQFITLAQNVGLDALPVKNQHSEQDLFDCLKNSGPVWFAGFWFGVGHIIVLTGVDRGKVFFNDPAGMLDYIRRYRSVAENTFNTRHLDAQEMGFIGSTTRAATESPAYRHALRHSQRTPADVLRGVRIIDTFGSAKYSRAAKNSDRLCSHRSPTIFSTNKRPGNFPGSCFFESTPRSIAITPVANEFLPGHARRAGNLKFRLSSHLEVRRPFHPAARPHKMFHLS